MKKAMKTKRYLGLVCSTLFGFALFAAIPRAQESAPENIALGVQVWGQNCARCHNAPPPTAFRDEEWKIITHHMKLRANLTDSEISAVLAYLQAAN